MKREKAFHKCKNAEESEGLFMAHKRKVVQEIDKLVAERKRRYMGQMNQYYYRKLHLKNIRDLGL